jgi:hypothetical protein
MKLALVRGSEKHNGFMICDMDTETTLMYVDGNSSKHVPVAVLSIDPHVVYGMSHPAAVSRILSDGPQTLLSIKRIAHSMFEHGMKAAWGSIMLGPTPIFTQLPTFYNLVESFSTTCGLNSVFVASVHSFPKEDKAYLKVIHGGKTYIVAPTGVKPQIEEPVEKYINLDAVLDYVLFDNE